MTNRMILNDPQLSMMPKNSRDWTFVQRQFAEDTAPGFMSVVLLDNFLTTATTTTFATVTDKNDIDLSISLKASVKYYVSVFGSYTRGDDKDVKFRLVLGGGGAVAGQPEDSSWAHYVNATGTDVIVHQFNPLNASGRIMGTTSGAGYSFGLEGFISVTTAGELTMEFAENDAGVDATLYAGTRLIAQPILNLSDRGNP